MVNLEGKVPQTHTQFEPRCPDIRVSLYLISCTLSLYIFSNFVSLYQWFSFLYIVLWIVLLIWLDCTSDSLLLSFCQHRSVNSVVHFIGVYQWLFCSRSVNIVVSIVSCSKCCFNSGSLCRIVKRLGSVARNQALLSKWCIVYFSLCWHWRKDMLSLKERKHVSPREMG